MSKLTISELCPAGTQFFSGPETFLNALTDDDLINTKGGGTPLFGASVLTAGFLIGYIGGAWYNHWNNRPPYSPQPVRLP